MNTYIIPIKVAFLIFPILSFLLILPFLFYQHKTYGYYNKISTSLLYFFILYLIIIFYLTTLPILEYVGSSNVQSSEMVESNFKPFKFVTDIKSQTKAKLSEPSSYKLLLTENLFLLVIFNIIILMPLGTYLNLYFNKSLKKSLIIILTFSLALRLTRLIIEYRLCGIKCISFDIDQLILNTLGGLIGYVLAPLFNFFLPISKLDNDLDMDSLERKYFRRLVSYLIDSWIIELIIGINKDITKYILVYFLYFILGVYFTNGKTIGKWLTGTKVVGKNDKIKFKEVILRYGLLYYGYFGVNKVINDIIVINQSTNLSVYMMVLQIFHLLFNISVWGHVLLSIINKDRVFYEKVSNTYIEFKD